MDKERTDSLEKQNFNAVNSNAENSNISMASSSVDTDIEKEYVINPYNCSEINNEKVILNSGALNYEVVDFTLPGRNGLDLEIKRRYDSSIACDEYFTSKSVMYYSNVTYSCNYYIKTSNYDSTGKLISSDFMPRLLAQRYFTGPGYSDCQSQATSAFFSYQLQYPSYQWYFGGYYSHTVTMDNLIFTGGTVSYKWYTDTLNYSYGNRFSLGYGWQFSVPTIETRSCVNEDNGTSMRDYSFIHLNDGRVFRLPDTFSTKEDESNLKGYKIKDLRLEKIGGTLTHGGQTVNYKYILHHKDGKKEYLNDSVLVAVEDRFENKILYKFESDGQVSIWDTIGRKIQLIKTKISDKEYKLQWSGLPESCSCAYHIENSCLKKVIDQANLETEYSHTTKNTWALYYEKSSSKEDTAHYVKNYALTSVTYPTGAKTNYGYESKRVAIGNDGYEECLCLCQRYDQEAGNNTELNSEEYSYEFSKNKVTKTTHKKNLPNNTLFITDYNFDSNQLLSEKMQSSSGTEKLKQKYRYKNDLLTEIDQSLPIDLNEYFEYDNKGNLTEHIDAEKRVTKYEYDTKNYSLLTKKTYTINDNTSVVEVNALSGDNKSVTEYKVFQGTKGEEALVRRTGYVYDSYGNVTEEKRYYGPNLASASTYHSTKLSYTNGVSLNNKKCYKGTSTLLSEEKYTYNAYGWLKEKTDGNGTVTTYDYNKLGKLLKKTNEGTDGSSCFKQWTYTVNPTTNRIVELDELGYQTRYEYTPLGKISEVYNQNTGFLMESYIYDIIGRKQQKTEYLADSKKRITTYTYDYLDRVTAKVITDQSGTELYKETTSYNDGSLKETKTITGGDGAENLVTTFTYDKVGQVTNESGPKGSFTRTYDGQGNLRSEKNSLGQTKKWEYDVAGNITKEEKDTNVYQSYTYDALGNKASYTDYNGNKTTYEYDPLGRLLTQISPAEKAGATIYTSKTIYTYDNVGNVLSNKVQCNKPGQAEKYRTEAYKYNYRNQQIQIAQYEQDGSEKRTTIKCDSKGNKLEIVTDLTGSSASGGRKTSYTYDRFGNITGITYPDNTKESMVYGITGLLDKKTDRAGYVTVYTYDNMGRVLTEKVTASNGAIEDTITYTYTKTGEKRSEKNGALTVTYNYNNKGLLEQAVESDGVTKKYTYDACGNRVSFTVFVGGKEEIKTTYDYNKLSQLTKVYEKGALIAQYSYDANGNRTQLQHNNGSVEHHTYSPGNLPSQIQFKKSGAVTDTMSYSYYMDGNLAEKKEGGKTTAYTYDSLGRLLQETNSDGETWLYAYDRYSNRVKLEYKGQKPYTVTYTYDNGNRLLSETKVQGKNQQQTAYSYDKNGNQVKKESSYLCEKGEKRGNVSFASELPMLELCTYNGRNQIIKVFKDNTHISYRFRPDGQRHKKQVQKGTTNTVRRHIWDGEKMAGELGAGNSVVARYIRGDKLLARVQDNATQYYLHDAHGDVKQLLDSWGNVLSKYEYDAFGVELEPNTLDSNPFRYVGEYYDSELGSIYLRARQYSPVNGRFYSKDSVQYISHKLPNDYETLNPLSMNLYAYCHNNPVRYKDVNGQFIGAAIGAVVGGTIGGITAAIKGEDIWRNVSLGAIAGATAGLGVDIALATVATGGAAGAAIAWAAGSGFAAGAGGNIAAQMLGGRKFGDVDLKSAIISGGIGAVANTVSFGLSSGISQAFNTPLLSNTVLGRMTESLRITPAAERFASAWFSASIIELPQRVFDSIYSAPTNIYTPSNIYNGMVQGYNSFLSNTYSMVYGNAAKTYFAY